MPSKKSISQPMSETHFICF